MYPFDEHPIMFRPCSSIGNESIMWTIMDEEEEDVSMLLYMGMDMNSDDDPAAAMSWSLLGWSDDIKESLAFGDGDDDDDDKFLSLFLIVEFQKFFISLSVRPGNLAAIWDHLHINKLQGVSFQVIKMTLCCNANACMVRFAWKRKIVTRN